MKRIILLLLCFILLCPVTWAQTTSAVDLPKARQGSPFAPRPSDAEEKKITIYPNPSNGVVQLTLSGFKGNRTEIRVMNVIGNVVHREFVNDPDDRITKTIDLTKFASGLYYIKLQADDFSEIRKVIIN